FVRPAALVRGALSRVALTNAGVKVAGLVGSARSAIALGPADGVHNPAAFGVLASASCRWRFGPAATAVVTDLARATRARHHRAAPIVDRDPALILARVLVGLAGARIVVAVPLTDSIRPRAASLTLDLVPGVGGVQTARRVGRTLG